MSSFSAQEAASAAALAAYSFAQSGLQQAAAPFQPGAGAGGVMSEHGAKPQQSKGGNRSGAPRSHMKKWRPFVEARAYAQAQQLKTGQRGWKAWIKEGKKPTDIPSNPCQVYKNDGWKGYGDWLGSGVGPRGKGGKRPNYRKAAEPKCSVCRTAGHRKSDHQCPKHSEYAQALAAKRAAARNGGAGGIGAPPAKKPKVEPVPPARTFVPAPIPVDIGHGSGAGSAGGVDNVEI